MNIFLTCATGFLGGELLVNLAQRPGIDKIFCLVRSSSIDQATQRLQQVFDLHGDPFDREKIIPVLGDFFDKQLAASLQDNAELARTDIIIHCAANTSFSKIYDHMVDQVNIRGLEKLLIWARALLHLQTFVYVGTATICGKEIKNRVVHEDESPNLQAQHLVRYTYTKMQGELMLDKYLPRQQTLIVRPSIIMGDSRPVVPRSPVILWTVATINKLRLIPTTEYAILDMIPVDYAARAIVELLFVRRNYHTYHISAGAAGATSTFKLAQSLSPLFPDLPPFHFIRKPMINQVRLWSKNNLKPGSELYNYPLYLDYWQKVFPKTGSLRILLAGLTPYLEFIELGQSFDNMRLLKELPSIKQSPAAHDYIGSCVPYMEKINILEGAIDP